MYKTFIEASKHRDGAEELEEAIESGLQAGRATSMEKNLNFIVPGRGGCLLDSSPE